MSADACTDSVETSVSSSVSDAVSFSTFRMSVKSVLKQWPTMGRQRHKRSSWFDMLCCQLEPFCPLTLYSKIYNVLWLRKTLRRPGEVAKGNWH